jgi:hypothetical protein
MITRNVRGERPTEFENKAKGALPTVDVPAGWEVYNATRPIPGTLTWINFTSGASFWAAVDPADPDAELYRKHLSELDAARIVWWDDMPAIRERIQAYYDERMPGRVKVADYDDRTVFQQFIKHIVEKSLL